MTDMTVCGVKGKPMKVKGIVFVALTIGSKTMATAFFVARTQGNFSLILGRDWIHANRCVPSTLHQLLIQWIEDEVEIVRGEASTCVATIGSATTDMHDIIECLSSLDFSRRKFIGYAGESFVHAIIEPMKDRLNHLM